jgi:hypothetical protein
VSPRRHAPCSSLVHEAQLDALEPEVLIMGDAFRNGGFGMYPTTIFGLLLVAAAIRYALTPERRFVPLQLSLGVLTLASGGLGFVSGLIKSVSAIGGVAAEQRWIWVVGMGEALNCVALALLLVTLGSLAASVGAVRLGRLTAAAEPAA